MAIYKRKISDITADSKGNYKDSKLIGTLWMHTGNNRIYEIVGYVWHGDTDLWHIKLKTYFDRSKLEFTRSIENFKGKRGEQPRFIQITRDSVDNEIDE